MNTSSFSKLDVLLERANFLKMTFYSLPLMYHRTGDIADVLEQLILEVQDLKAEIEKIKKDLR